MRSLPYDTSHDARPPRTHSTDRLTRTHSIRYAPRRRGGGCAHPSPYLALPMVRHLGGHLSATSASPRVAETEVGTRDELEREGESRRRHTLRESTQEEARAGKLWEFPRNNRLCGQWFIDLISPSIKNGE